MMLTNLPFAPRLLTATVAFALIAGQAQAAPAFQIEKKDVAENSGSWTVNMRIELAKAPSTPRVPMNLYISRTTEFRRQLEDGKKDPVMHALAIRPPKTSIESVDVDFADTKGTIFKATKFSYRLSRSAGYIAGVYSVQLKTQDGNNVGGASELTLRGDNPVEDVRTMDFGPKKEETTESAKPRTDFTVPENDVKPAGTPPPFLPEEAYKPTEEENIKVKPKGGCGCDTARAPGLNYAWAALPLALVLRRRRRA